MGRLRAAGNSARRKSSYSAPGAGCITLMVDGNLMPGYKVATGPEPVSTWEERILCVLAAPAPPTKRDVIAANDNAFAEVIVLRSAEPDRVAA
jgi:hypothetical protein